MTDSSKIETAIATLADAREFFDGHSDVLEHSIHDEGQPFTVNVAIRVRDGADPDTVRAELLAELEPRRMAGTVWNIRIAGREGPYR